MIKVIRQNYDGSTDLPPAISAHQLLYGTSSGLQFPVSIHNITNESTVAVKMTITEKDNPERVVFTDEQTVQIEKGAFKTISYDIQQNPGHYVVKIEAMGVEAYSNWALKRDGKVTLTEVDLNDDGVNEYYGE